MSYAVALAAAVLVFLGPGDTAAQEAADRFQEPLDCPPESVADSSSFGQRAGLALAGWLAVGLASGVISKDPDIFLVGGTVGGALGATLAGSTMEGPNFPGALLGAILGAGGPLLLNRDARFAVFATALTVPIGAAVGHRAIPPSKPR